MKTTASRVARRGTARLGLPIWLIPNLIAKKVIAVRNDLLMIKVETAVGENTADSQKHSVQLFLREVLYEGLWNELSEPKQLTIGQVAQPEASWFCSLLEELHESSAYRARDVGVSIILMDVFAESRHDGFSERNHEFIWTAGERMFLRVRLMTQDTQASL
jgi:hypothetical protein